jgi:4-amino-4-deoxy-L-arabinose transferase-like glycosyltransferase
MSERSRIGAVALGIFAVGVVLRFHGLGWGLPAVYEEAYPFKKAWDMWGWGADKRFDLNPHFFNYPTLFFYLQFLGQGLLYLVHTLRGAVHSTLDFRVLYELDKSSFYLLGRGIAALMGAGTVLVTFAVGRRIGGLAVAAAAAALVAVNQSHIAKSQAIEVDVPMTFLAMLAYLFALRVLERPRRRDLLLAALCGGLATSTKYNGAFLALPIGLAFLLGRRVISAETTGVPGAASGKASTGKRGAVPRAGATGSPWTDLLLASALFAAVFLLTSPYVLIDRKAFWTGFNYERLHMRVGHFGLDQTPAILWYLRVMGGTLLGWPLALLALGGLVQETLVRRRRWALVLAVFPVAYLTVICSWSMKAERYVLPLLPLAAVYASTFVASWVPRLRRFGDWAPAAATAVAVLVMVTPSLAAYRRDLARLRGDTRTLARQWIEANVPAGSLLVLEAYGPEPMGIIDIANMSPDVRERVQKAATTKVYAVVPMPMYQIMSENTAIFYDLKIYDDIANVIATSSSVSSRYRKNPSQFAAQCAFYDSLAARWTALREFGPADGHGPRITLWGNPRQPAPFAQRRDVTVPPAPPVVRDLLPGSFAGFFERLAYHYEAYGFSAQAAEVYLQGVRYRDQPYDAQRSLLLGAVRTSIAAGRRDQALGILDQVLRALAGRPEAKSWADLRAKVAAGAVKDARTDTTQAP